MGDFSQGTIDILVGTQLVTKGYHFPGVSLVGVIWADANLGLPSYTAAENTLQQLIQVAGRAGRTRPSSLVIVQKLIDHELFNYTQEEKYRDFYTYELAYRKLLAYPPCGRFAELELRHTNEKIVEEEAQLLADTMLWLVDTHKLAALVLGPVQPPVYKIKNWYMRKIYIKSSSIDTIHQLYQARPNITSQLFFTPNPV